METRARILCVDDDEGIRKVVVASLRDEYDVVAAENGADALRLLSAHPDTAVIISDMWMPGIDGVALLKAAHETSPDIIRVLLTGQPDLQTAIDSVNQGHVFRFLAKPIPVPDLRQAIADSVAQHRLVTAERVLLEQTLHGSIRALTEVLSLASPIGFGRATRVKELVTALSNTVQLPRSWRVELAAMLSQLATITLPDDTLERLCYGRELSIAETAMVERLPMLNDQLLAHIPRLEPVRAILLAAQTPPPKGVLAGEDAEIMRAAQLLRVALAFDLLQMEGLDASTAVSMLRTRAPLYDAAMLDALVALSGTISRELHELPLAGLKPGMVLVGDLTLSTGMLLVCGGATVTVSLLERLKNLPRDSVPEPIRVQTSRAWSTAAS